MAGRQLRRRTVGPVFDDQLLLRREVAAVGQHVVDVGLVAGRALQIVRAGGNFGPVVKLVCRAQGKRPHLVPMRCDEGLGRAQVVDQRLPLVGVGDVQRTGCGGGRQAKRHRRIGWCIKRVVGIGTRAQIAVLVGAIVAAGGDHCGCRRIADALSGVQVGGQVERVVALGLHHRRQARGTCRKEIAQAMVGRMTDGLGFLTVVLLGQGAARQGRHRSHGTQVVWRPGVVQAGMGHRQCPRHDGRPQAGAAYFVQRRLVPGDYHANVTDCMPLLAQFAC